MHPISVAVATNSGNAHGTGNGSAADRRSSQLKTGQ